MTEQTNPTPDKSVLETALRLLESDPHSFSTRPCQTCRAVSALAGRPFGCNEYAKGGHKYGRIERA